MKIFGNIEVVSIDKQNNRKIIARGKNSFCNTGKQHICDWLMHDNYSEDVAWDGANLLSGGRSLSDTKIIPYNEVQIYRIGTHDYIQNIDNCMYPFSDDENTTNLRSGNTTWDEDNYNPQYGTLYWEFKTPKNIKAIILKGHHDSRDIQHLIDISTSPNTFAENTNWTRQNVKTLAVHSGDTQQNIHVLRFDYYNHPGRVLENVKCLRWRTRWDYRDNYWMYIYGIWFLEDNSYPNTPSVIALGSDNTSPSETDIALGDEKIRKFIRLHKDTGNDYQVKYSMRLNFDEGNNITFKEVGLFFHEKNGDYIGGNHQADYCQKLFSRGVFDTPWSKTDSEMIDVDYVLTIQS